MSSGYIFITKLSYLSSPEYQATSRPGEWVDNNEVFTSLKDALRFGASKVGEFCGPDTKVKITEIVDFDVNDNELVKYKYDVLGNLIKI